MNRCRKCKKFTGSGSLCENCTVIENRCLHHWVGSGTWEGQVSYICTRCQKTEVPNKMSPEKKKAVFQEIKPANGSYDLQWSVPNSAGTGSYTVSYRDGNHLLSGNGYLCSCVGWTSHVPRKDCKHIRFVREKQKEVGLKIQEKVALKDLVKQSQSIISQKQADWLNKHQQNAKLPIKKFGGLKTVSGSQNQNWDWQAKQNFGMPFGQQVKSKPLVLPKAPEPEPVKELFTTMKRKFR